MIAFRDILIFAGLAALAAAVIASLFPAGEGVSAVPACSDCAFKLTGGYWVLQHSSYASLYLGTREVARYGWAYVDGWPLRIGENVTCDPMYVYVLNGVAYISCRDGGAILGRRVLRSVTESLAISSNSRETGCRYTVSVSLNASTTVTVRVYDENNRLVYSASGTPPVTFTFRVPMAGTYRMHIYAPPLLDDWYTLHAEVVVTGTKTAVFKGNNTQDLRPNISLKVFDLTDYWRKGYGRVSVYINPAGLSTTLSIPSFAFADFLLAWEECYECDQYDFEMYNDEMWRLTFHTILGPTLTHMGSGGFFWHEVYADGQLIWTWDKDGPKNIRYTGSDPSITVKFVSKDSSMNAEATFTKVCRWS